jgi:hypothetical protein
VENVSIRLGVSFDEAKRCVAEIPHKSCQSALEGHLHRGGAVGVTAQSVCWLYCWAKTGQRSAAAANEAKRVFTAVFDRPYDWFAARVPLGTARKLRYKLRDVEAELARLLA